MPQGSRETRLKGTRRKRKFRFRSRSPPLTDWRNSTPGQRRRSRSRSRGSRKPRRRRNSVRRYRPAHPKRRRSPRPHGMPLHLDPHRPSATVFDLDEFEQELNELMGDEVHEVLLLEV